MSLGMDFGAADMGLGLDFGAGLGPLDLGTGTANLCIIGVCLLPFMNSFNTQRLLFSSCKLGISISSLGLN